MMKKYSKGKVIHSKKGIANSVAKKLRGKGKNCKVTKLKKGWRVDRRY
jgi:hypothetical protein